MEGFGSKLPSQAAKRDQSNPQADENEDRRLNAKQEEAPETTAGSRRRKIGRRKVRKKIGKRKVREKARRKVRKGWRKGRRKGMR